MTEFVPADEEERCRVVTHVEDVPLATIRPGSVTRIVPAENMTLSFLTLSPGLQASLHSHPHEQVVVVLEGDLDLAMDGKLFHAHAGDVVVIPGGVPHSAVTYDKPCRVLDIFSPARADFEQKLAKAKMEQGQ